MRDCPHPIVVLETHRTAHRTPVFLLRHVYIQLSENPALQDDQASAQDMLVPSIRFFRHKACTYAKIARCTRTDILRMPHMREFPKAMHTGKIAE